MKQDPSATEPVWPQTIGPHLGALDFDLGVPTQAIATGLYNEMEF